MNATRVALGITSLSLLAGLAACSAGSHQEAAGPTGSPAATQQPTTVRQPASAPAIAAPTTALRSTDPTSSGPTGSTPTEAGTAQVVADRAAAERVVRSHGYNPNSGQWYPNHQLNAIVGVVQHSADGAARQTFFFVGNRYIGTDKADVSANSYYVAGANRTVTIGYPIYGPSDPMCCPSGGNWTVRFHWNGSRLVPLDPINAPTPVVADRAAAERVVKSMGYGVNSDQWNSAHTLNAIIGVRLPTADAHTVHAFFFVGNRYIGKDTIDPSWDISYVGSTDQTVTLSYTIFNPVNPTHPISVRYDTRAVRFHWNGSNLVALDQIPPVHSTTRAGR